jgi:hypothetical protein
MGRVFMCEDKKKAVKWGTFLEKMLADNNKRIQNSKNLLIPYTDFNI